MTAELRRLIHGQVAGVLSCMRGCERVDSRDPRRFGDEYLLNHIGEMVADHMQSCNRLGWLQVLYSGTILVSS